MKLNDKQIKYLDNLNEKLKSANWEKLTMSDQIGNLTQRYAIAILKNINQLHDNPDSKAAQSNDVGNDLLSAFKNSVSKDDWKL